MASTSQVEFRKDLFADERDDNLAEIGKPHIRQDILGHVTGRSPFYDDHLFDGLLHMRCVRSPHHHARIRSVDTSAAERAPGVVRIIRPSDVPQNMNTLLGLINFGRDDEPLLSPEKTGYKGEPILAIIATSVRAAQDAVAAVKVDWEVLPYVLDVEAALAPDAPTVNATYPNNTFDYHDRYDHQKLRFGDVAAGFAEAAHIVEGEYQMSPIEQAPMETCGAIAAPETNDRFVCYTGSQGLFFSVAVAAKQTGLPSSRLHFIGGTVGGGFGGKVDSHHEPLAILGAMLTGRPVKYQWDRAEEMQVGAPRSGERWRIKDGVAADGRILARQFTGFFDAGAYTRLTSYGVQKCNGHLPGPDTIPNVASNAYCVYTNRTPSTAMRGFGITGVDFAIECQMDRVAEAVGMDPIELRILNAYRDGDMKAHRRVAKNCALIESCQVVAAKAGWALSPAAQQASSLLDGGVGWRADIPETVIDHSGEIGERKRTGLAPEPGAGVTTRETVPPGTFTDHPATGNAPQRADMEAEAERLGFKVATGATAAPPVPMPAASSLPSSGQKYLGGAPPVAPFGSSDPGRRAEPPRTQARSSEVTSSSGPSLPAAARPGTPAANQGPRAGGWASAPPDTTPTSPGSARPPAEPPQPAPPPADSARQPRRPGVSRFLSGPRGRR
ncbi:MAG: molybdopterin cofactor-binding domain-containing protein [Pseudomonadota bacterium]